MNKSFTDNISGLQPLHAGLQPGNSLQSAAAVAILNNSDRATSRFCEGCDALKQELQLTSKKVIELSETVDQLKQVIQERDRKKSNNKSTIVRPASEVYKDKNLLRIKASMFVNGRGLSAHVCKQHVIDIFINEPPYAVEPADIKLINDRHECRDAPSLTKWAVFELFSLNELVGRNCLGGGHNRGADPSTEIKKAFDPAKMRIIKDAVFQLYPESSESAQRAVWMKCVDKVNTDVTYLFKVSLAKHDWLQVGL